MLFTYNDVNRQRFVDELQAIDIDFNNVIISGLDESNIGAIVTILDNDESVKTLVEQVYSAHDATPIPTPKTESEILREENEQLRSSLADLWEVVLLGGAE